MLEKNAQKFEFHKILNAQSPSPKLSDSDLIFVGL